MVRAGYYDGAYMLYNDRLNTPSHYEFGNPLLEIDLLRAPFPDGEGAPPPLTDERDQDWLLHALGLSYILIGQPGRAIALLEQAVALNERLGDTHNNLATSLANLAGAQVQIGRLHVAETNLRRSIVRSQEFGGGGDEASARRDLGMLLAFRGCLQEAVAEFTAARMFEPAHLLWSEWACRAQWSLLLARFAALGVLIEPQGPDAATHAAEALTVARNALAEVEYAADYC